jgi:hypothetical protein
MFSDSIFNTNDLELGWVNKEHYKYPNTCTGFWLTFARFVVNINCLCVIALIPAGLHAYKMGVCWETKVRC